MKTIKKTLDRVLPTDRDAREALYGVLFFIIGYITLAIIGIVG
jgi:hypothetical protein